MRIKGSCEQVTAQLKERKNIQCRKRFEEAIAYFSRLEEMLALFNNSRDSLLETNSHFGSLKQSAQRQMRQLENQQSHAPTLVFDFGLILRQHTLFHAGLTFAVVIARQR